MRIERNSRLCTFDELHPSLDRAIRGYFQSHGLGDPEAETRLCCETLTIRPPSSKLRSLLEGNIDSTSRLAALLTPDWFVWAASGDRRSTVIAGIRLMKLKTKVMVANRSKEFRLEISGFVNDSKEYIRGSLELGAEPAAERFCGAVSTAVQELNPPPPKERRRWFGV